MDFNATIKKYKASLTHRYGEKNAAELAFHLSDWDWDAAFYFSYACMPR